MTGKLLCCVLLAWTSWAQAPAGRWDGTAAAGGLKIPFRIDFEGEGEKLRGTLAHGDARLASTSGSFSNGVARLEFGAARLEAKLADGQLTGTFGKFPFTASPYCTCGVEGEAGPDIAGTWDAGEAGTIVARRIGEDTVAAAFGYAALAGRFDGIAFQLHYFDGARAALVELEPKDGGLAVSVKTPGEVEKRYRAVRASR